MGDSVREKRKFSSNIPNHIYRLANESNVIFYSDIDRLVYHSLRSCLIRRYEGTALSSCIMFDHTHELVSYRAIESMRLCEGETAAMFARMYNADKHIIGPLFKTPFGSAPKRTGKDVRSCANYIANNAPEKRLCQTAVEYRWNFLAYSLSSHPFSEKFIPNESSQRLRSAIKTVRKLARDCQHLEYAFVRTLKKKLSGKEWLQFLDIAIQEYLYIDFNACAEYFGGIQNMITAPDSNTGKEFDLKEEYGFRSHRPYCRMVTILNSAGYENPFDLADTELARLMPIMDTGSEASFPQIAKFLRLPIETVRNELLYSTSSVYGEI